MHTEQNKAVKAQKNDSDKPCIPVPFDTIHPNDILQFPHTMPKDISIAEENYINYTIKKLSDRILRDVIKVATEGVLYLDQTQQFRYSRLRCEDYYKVVKCLSEMMFEVCQATDICYMRMFNIAWKPSIMRPPIRFELYRDLCPTNVTEELLRDKNYALLMRYPFLLETTWSIFVDKMYALKDAIDVGTRLSIEYTLAHYEFCEKECCKMPDLPITEKL